MTRQFQVKHPTKCWCNSPHDSRQNIYTVVRPKNIDITGRETVERISRLFTVSARQKIANILHETSINFEKILHGTLGKILKNFIVRRQTIYWPLPVKFPTIYRDNLPWEDRQNIEISLYNAGIISIIIIFLTLSNKQLKLIHKRWWKKVVACGSETWATTEVHMN